MYVCARATRRLLAIHLGALITHNERHQMAGESASGIKSAQTPVHTNKCKCKQKSSLAGRRPLAWPIISAVETPIASSLCPLGSSLVLSLFIVRPWPACALVAGATFRSNSTSRTHRDASISVHAHTDKLAPPLSTCAPLLIIFDSILKQQQVHTPSNGRRRAQRFYLLAHLRLLCPVAASHNLLSREPAPHTH